MDKLSQALVNIDNEVKLPKKSEVCRIQHAVEQVLKAIFDTVQRDDPRLIGTLLPVGSYYSDLKINTPDEFDFLYELQTLEENVNFVVRPSGFRGSRNLWRTPKGDAGKRKIQVTNPPASLFRENDPHNEIWLQRVGTDTEGHGEYILHPVHVKNSLFSGITKAVSEIDKSTFPKYLSLDTTEWPTFLYGPATTLFFEWNGRFYKNLKISVDITACIKASQWEGIIDCLQPGKMNEHSCLKNKIHQEVIRHGYHLVPFISDRGHIQWRISTSFLETKILSKFPKDSSFKRLLRVVKSKKGQYLKHRPDVDCLNNQVLIDVVRFDYFFGGKDYDENYRHLVSSFLIKNSIFQLCGSVTSSQWRRAKLGPLYIVACSTLYIRLAEGNCRSFFVSEQKLNHPALGEILPGFFKIFKEVDDFIMDQFHDEVVSNWECLVRAYPFETKTVCSFYHMVRDQLHEVYHFLWNGNEHMDRQFDLHSHFEYIGD